MARKLALLSVYNKVGIVEFAEGLVQLDFDILASGGTAKALLAAGIPVVDVSVLVGGKAILGHRVVTLSRELYASLLATNSPEDVAELERLGLRRIDLVRVDMYPLREEIKNLSATIRSVIEKTDVGGPTMLHGGAKGERIVVCDSADCERVLDWLHDGTPDAEVFTRKLMAKAETTVARYVFESARFHGQGEYAGFFGERHLGLRYGENPSQTSSWYKNPDAAEDRLSLDKFKLVGGEGPSFINVTDHDRLVHTAVRLAAGFEQNGTLLFTALAVKHGNVCGVGVSRQPIKALEKMIESDPTSLFGGCVLVDFPVDQLVADILRIGGSSTDRPLDVVVAPEFTPGGIARLSRKNGKCRMYENPALRDLGMADLDASEHFRHVRGGFLVQQPNRFVLRILPAWKEVLSTMEQFDLLTAWAICATSNSNTIALVKDGCLIGRGVAQPSRVLACKVALLHARENGHEKRLGGAVAASDSFFPVDDGPTVLAGAGIGIIFATSGSMSDGKVAETCQRLRVRLLQLPDAEARGFFGH